MTTYVIEIARTVNKKTGAKRYFKVVCDVLTRISLKEYDEIHDCCRGVCNLFTTSNKNITKHYTSCIIEVVTGANW
jgi:hypothetical protein